MKFSPQVLAAAVIVAASLPLTSCSAPNGYSYSNISIKITAYCSDCPSIIPLTNPNPPNAIYMAPGGGQGGTIQLTANVTNAPSSEVTWTIYPTPNLTIPNPPPTSTSGSPGAGGSNVGTFNTPSGVSNLTATGGTVYYSNGGLQVYSGAQLQQAEAMGIPQGDVLIVASVPSDPSNPSATVSASQLIQIYNSSNTTPTLYLSPSEPTIPAGLTTSVVTVAHNGGTFQFYGGAIGEQPCTSTSTCLIQGVQYPLDTADNSVIWEISPTNNVANASAACNTPNGTNQSPAQCPYGWISSTGLYTAPPTIPPAAGGGLAAGQISIVVASHFLPTITKFAYLTID